MVVGQVDMVGSSSTPDSSIESLMSKILHEKKGTWKRKTKSHLLGKSDLELEVEPNELFP